MESQKKKSARWRDIFKELKNEIGRGVYSDDNPLPSEKRLGLRYGVSRITVVCESDFVATQLRATLEKLGLSVPRDVRLAGFDDVRCASVMTPPLTTVHQPCEDLARTAYQTLIDRLRDPSLPVRRILLPAPLVVRDSTR